MDYAGRILGLNPRRPHGGNTKRKIRDDRHVLKEDPVLQGMSLLQNMANKGNDTVRTNMPVTDKIEKVPRGIRGEKSSKDMASSRNLVSTIGAQASPTPTMGDGTRCPEG